MAYFPNGTSQMIFTARQCDICQHWKEDENEAFHCPIMDAHFSGNYEQCKNKEVKAILELLIPTNKDGFPDKCRMFEHSEDCIGQMKLFEVNDGNKNTN